VRGQEVAEDAAVLAHEDPGVGLSPPDDVQEFLGVSFRVVSIGPLEPAPRTELGFPRVLVARRQLVQGLQRVLELLLGDPVDVADHLVRQAARAHRAP
jgi:hypothetical protein